MWLRRCVIPIRDRGRRSGAIPGFALVDLFIPHDNRPDFSGLPVGQPASGSWLFGDLFCAGPPPAEALGGKASLVDHALAAALVGLSANVLLGLRQAAERRSDVAQSHRSEVSLRNPALADLDR